MSGFLYYVPGGTRRITLDELRVRGLGHAFDRPPTAAEILARGPDGGTGVIVADPQRVPAARIRMAAGEQVWRRIGSKSPEQDGHPYVGYWLAEKPGPADLLRSPALSGHAVTLGDEREWLCPIARWLTGDPALPRASELSEDGQWQPGPVLGRYQRLWDIACRWWDTLSRAEVIDEGDGARMRFDFDGLHAAAVDCLQAQYAIGPVECAMLGLLNEQAAVEVLNAVVDWPTLKRWIEKKTRDADPVTAAT